MPEFLFSLTALVVCLLFALILIGASVAAWQVQKARRELYAIWRREVLGGLAECEPLRCTCIECIGNEVHERGLAGGDARG